LEDQPLSTFGNTISHVWFLIDAAKLRFNFENRQYFSDFFTEKALSETIFAILIQK
jgi:hypothetical protein